MLKLDFVGIRYKTIEERESYVETLDTYQLAKLEFIDYMYTNENTMFSMWGIYNNYVHPQELILQKDAMFFDNTDIENIVYAKFNNRQITRNAIITFISKYQEWGIEVRGDIKQNATKLINRTEVIRNKSKILRNKLFSLEELYSLLRKIKKNNSIDNTIPLLLSRYGICGKECKNIISLTWGNINWDDKIIEIIDEKTGEIRSYEVDDEFLRYMLLIRPENYENSQLVLSTNNDSSYTSAGILNKVSQMCLELEINRISFRDMIQSRKIDYLLTIRKYRKLSLYDVEKVYNKFSEGKGYSGMNALRLFYEDLTGDKILFKKEVSKYNESYILIDDNSEKVVNDICKKLNYKLPNNLDVKEFLDKVRD